jgi:ABC-type nickel/cobalt efflux system permease component RcnA
MGWFLRLSCLVIVLFGFYVIWQFVIANNMRAHVPPPHQHHAPQSVPAAYHPLPSVPALPVDHIAQRLGI